MATPKRETLISDERLSSVVPSKVTGENTIRELTDIDIALKLHYIKGIYFFDSESVRDLTVPHLKKLLFSLLNLYFGVAGRIRLPESGRPFIKCNDSGVRIVEANSEKSVEEWLKMEDCGIDFDSLVYSQVLGPDLGFSPLVFIQFTWFKCGGFSIGISWAHVLGDVFSASQFMNTLGKMVAGYVPPTSLPVPNIGEQYFSKSPKFLKQVHTIKNCWQHLTTREMGRYNFCISKKQLVHVATKSRVEAICAMFWKWLYEIRKGSGLEIVTICTNNYSDGEINILANGVVLSVVEADFSMVKIDVTALAEMIAKKMKNENGKIKNFLETENENSDFVLYGANLTFVNLETTNIYGFEMKGNKPVFANYTMDGVGDEGVVMVFSGSENGSGDGYTVGVVLPENEIVELKNRIDKILVKHEK